MLEDYEFPTRKVCPNKTKHNCHNFNPRGKFCSNCGTELIIEEVPLTIKVKATHLSFRGNKEEQINKEIEMDLDDFIRLLKSRWDITIPKQLSFIKKE